MGSPCGTLGSVAAALTRSFAEQQEQRAKLLQAAGLDPTRLTITVDADCPACRGFGYVLDFGTPIEHYDLRPPPIWSREPYTVTMTECRCASWRIDGTPIRMR